MMEQHIRKYFEDKNDVVAVYLFGSQASGKAGKQSDVDIGIVADGKNAESMLGKRLIFISELSRILRKDVHPVILNFASHQLIRQIFVKGKCILVNDKKRLALFNMFQFAKLAEFNYYKELTQSGFIKKVMEA
jgi:predicted nucleotidyltransferase